MGHRGPRDSEPTDEPGWWLASDGKWYPPESRAPQPAAVGTAGAGQSQWGAPPQQSWGGPQTQPQPGAWAAPPKKKRRLGLWIGLGVVALIIIVIIAAAAGGGDNKSSKTNITSSGGNTATTGSGTHSIDNGTNHPAAADIDGITKCTSDGFSSQASGTLTNHSSDRSNYLISVAFVRQDGSQAGTAAAFANDVESGQKADWNAVGPQVAGQFTCKVTTVTRFASP